MNLTHHSKHNGKLQRPGGEGTDQGAMRGVSFRGLRPGSAPLPSQSALHLRRRPVGGQEQLLIKSLAYDPALDMSYII